jgi:hypothetical protein
VEVTAEVRRAQFVRGFAIEAALRYSSRYDRDFRTLRTDGARNIEKNFGTELGVSWTPDR